MDQDQKLTVHVTYKYVGGAHFFVSQDKKIGLCVAHKDLKTAFEAVAPVLERLFKSNHGIETKFEPRVRFLEFKATLQKAWPSIDRATVRDEAITPGGGVAWKQAA